MAYYTQLVAGTKAWARVELDSIGGRDRHSPRLVIHFTMRTPTERIETKLHHLVVRAFVNDELLGEAAIVGGEASWHGSSCPLEVPVSHKLMRYASDSFPANADASLRLTWSGILRVRWRPGEGDTVVASDVAPNEWTFVDITETELRLGIPRSDWFGKVLQPMSDEQYAYLEVAVPQGDSGVDWHRALALVDEAEKAYAIGDDAGVFTKLRGAYEALPGYPKQIVDTLPEPRRGAVDDLLKHVGAHLHHGRHIATEGDDAGTFAVNRIDASAAIALVRVMFSYVSRALESARATTA